MLGIGLRIQTSTLIIVLFSIYLVQTMLITRRRRRWDLLQSHAIHTAATGRTRIRGLFLVFVFAMFFPLFFHFNAAVVHFIQKAKRIIMMMYYFMHACIIRYNKHRKR